MRAPRQRCADYSETGAGVKARQSSKIKELGDALIAIGCLSLDHQAEALGLARSTTWTILKASHKGSGLSATVINRMLATPQPPRSFGPLSSNISTRKKPVCMDTAKFSCADLLLDWPPKEAVLLAKNWRNTAR
jgi:hypothetical protein